MVPFLNILILCKIFSLKQNWVYTFKLLNFIESIFNDTGMGYVFANQDDSDNKWLLKQILHKINIFKNGTGDLQINK
jgi:hypothetical protein